MMKAAFLADEDLERLVLGADCVKTFLRERKRNLLVAFAVQEQERTAHFLHDAVEAKPFELLERRHLTVHPEHPLQVLRRHWEGEHLSARKIIDPRRPDGVITP